MKNKLFYIFSFLLLGLGINQCFGYDVTILGPNNEVLMMYPVEEGTTEIILEGDRVKNGNNFTFNGGYDGTTVYYTDIYGKDQHSLVNDDLYINGNYSISYTGEQYYNLVDGGCPVNENFQPVFDFTGSISVDTGNVFNNFSENMFKVLLSNIPSYIQYATIFAVIMLIVGLVRKLGRKKR